MRIPVNQLKGGARKRADTVEDWLADELSKTYTVARELTLEFNDEYGAHSMVIDVAIPSLKLIVEIQRTLDNKSIMLEVKRDKIARNNGWRICRITERQAKSEDLQYLIKREMERPIR